MTWQYTSRNISPNYPEESDLFEALNVSADITHVFHFVTAPNSATFIFFFWKGQRDKINIYLYVCL